MCVCMCVYVGVCVCVCVCVCECVCVSAPHHENFPSSGKDPVSSIPSVSVFLFHFLFNFPHLSFPTVFHLSPLCIFRYLTDKFG